MRGEYTRIKYIDDQGETHWATVREMNVNKKQEELAARGFIVHFCSVTGEPIEVKQ